MASRVRKSARFKRLIKDLPDLMRGELIVSLSLGGQKLLAAMKARAPRKTGALVSGLRMKVLPQTLRLRVGLIGTKSERQSLFYARILDLGRKGGVAKARRSGKGGIEGRLSRIRAGKDQRGPAYQVRVGAIAPKRFITGRFPELRKVMNDELNGIWNRALAKLGNGNE